MQTKADEGMKETKY